MDVFAGKNRSELLEIAQKVFDDRDSKDLIKQMGCTNMTVLQAPATLNSTRAHHDKNMRPLQKDQCAYYKESGSRSR